jgi:enoyl-CoA hydratase/carnithine racemase
VVAAVTGAAIGIGTTMLLHCDFVYVSDEARLAMPFVALGQVPEYASSLGVPQLMGHRRAAEKLLLGDPFTPVQAVECGIASAVLPAPSSSAAISRADPRPTMPSAARRNMLARFTLPRPPLCGP